MNRRIDHSRIPIAVGSEASTRTAVTPAYSFGVVRVLATLLLILLATHVHAQGDRASDPLRSFFGGDRQTADAAALKQEIPPVTRTVHAEYYVCGPGDVMALSLRQPIQQDAVLTVTADGSLLVPRLGALPIAGMTLSDARVHVFDVLKARYPVVEGSLSLVQARPILVTVQGEVETPGLLSVTAATPVSVAVQLASMKKTDETMTRMRMLQGEPSNTPDFRTRLGMRYFGRREMESSALRRITVHHTDGSSSHADIPMYEATRDPVHDPLLREGDLIIVPHRTLNVPDIAVLGAVQRPGLFEYMEGDRLSDLLRMGFGLDHTVNIVSAELQRGKEERFQLSVEQLRTGTLADDMLLQPGDRLMVYADRVRSTGGSAVVDGEVLRPGAYSILPGKTTVTELVSMAGGFTDIAWPGLSELYRRQTGLDGNALDLDRERERNFEKSNLFNEDTLYWIVSSRLREGQVAVNFSRLFNDNDTSSDVALFDGDILLVPQNTGTVYVYGQVNNSGFVPWSASRDFKWYIEQAGGYGESASKSRAAIIKGNTRAWMRPGDTTIEPGDMIYVPHTPLVRLSTTSDVLAVVAAIVGGLAGITSLLITVLRN